MKITNFMEKSVMTIVIITVVLIIGYIILDEAITSLSPKAKITVTNIEQNNLWFNFTLTFSNISTEEIKGETVHKAYKSKWNWDIEGIKVEVENIRFYDGDSITITVPKPLKRNPPLLLLASGGDLRLAIEITLDNETTLI